MKKTILIALVCLSGLLQALELGLETWDRYTVFEPDTRAMGMTFPSSWLEPDAFLFAHQYEDSSYTYGRWDQIYLIDPSAGGYFTLSNDIVVKYVPFSSPHRWSAGMEMIRYEGPSATRRTDAVLHYQGGKGSVEYYHTDNTQSLMLTGGIVENRIKSQGMTFDYRAGSKIRFLGGLDMNLIDQEDDSVRSYDAFHQFAEFRYAASQPLQFYGIAEFRYFRNEDRSNTMMVFRPGMRYRKGVFSTHLALRISPERIFPIAQIMLKPGPFNLEVYAKVRNPLFILRQPGYAYYGILAGVDHRGKHQVIRAAIDASYDNTGVKPGHVSAPTYIPPNFFSLKARAEYRLTFPALEFYGRAAYSETFDHGTYYYHPERATLTGGLAFHTKPAKGKLLWEGDLNAQYLVHDDPDFVGFDARTMTYALSPGGTLIGDWKFNLHLSARIGTFGIGLDISAPLDLYGGIYASSDILYGNTFYAGLTADWSWWK